MSKKVILILAAAVFLASCSKETEKCNCGIIANDGIDNGCYWLEIRNNCSGNKKTWCFDQDLWMSSYVGEEFCVTNVDSW